MVLSILEGVESIWNGVEHGAKYMWRVLSILEGVESIWNGDEYGAKYM
jgi:hypothetical protein